MDTPGRPDGHRARQGPSVLDEPGLAALVDALVERGYRVIGPTLEGAAIVLTELRSADALPAGWGVEVDAGRYRVRRRADPAVFAHSAGPQAWKRWLHPPRRLLWSGPRTGPWEAPAEAPPAYALLGVRGCDLAGLQRLQTVLEGGPHPDPSAVARSRALFVVAVNCTEPGGTCFCASLGTGPAAGPGYDLLLTEHADGAQHWFLAEAGTAAGAAVLAEVPHTEATDAQIGVARSSVRDAAGRMGRRLPDVDLPSLVRAARQSPQWEAVAERCLSCGNCTMVCPTCFCSTTEDVTDLEGEHAERWSHWSSCFDPDFSFLHGGSVRQSTASRYRQWLSHKLGTWEEQFGTSGCVGCGRCIAWCPVGIDITEEAGRMAAADPARRDGQ